MSTITKPMALDESFNTTETNPRSIADVLAGIEGALSQGMGRQANEVSYNNTTSGLSADDVQEAVDELAEEKVDKVIGKGLSTNDYTDAEKNKLEGIEAGAQVNPTIDSALSDSSTNAVQNKVVKGALDGKADNEDIASTKTVTGNPINITDAAPINAESLVVEFSPKQDLHGQNAPYVGGAGKNKLPMTVEWIKAANTSGTWSGNTYSYRNVTFTIITDNDGNIIGYDVTSNNASGVSNLYLTSNLSLPDGSYILNGCPAGSVGENYLLVAENFGDDSGSGVNVNISGNTLAIRIRVATEATFSTVRFLPMLRLATETNPTFAPYSNICPISGYEGVEVDDVGVNRWDEVWEVGNIDRQGQDESSNTTIRSKNYIPCQSNTEYRILIKSLAANNIVVYFYDTNKSLIPYTGQGAYNNGYNGLSGVFTTPNGTAYMRFRTTSTYGAVYNHDISINYPSTFTDYEPYHSSNATIQFGQTVYGGKVDFLTGECKVNRRYMDVDENTSISIYSGWRFRFEAQGFNSPNVLSVANIICNRMKTFAKQWMPQIGGISASDANTNNILFSIDSSVTTIEDAKAWLSNNPLQVCYELAEPFTIQLTPQELKLLKQYNNITTNGTTINLGYQPDNVIGELKGEIQNATQNVSVAPPTLHAYDSTTHKMGTNGVTPSSWNVEDMPSQMKDFYQKFEAAINDHGTQLADIPADWTFIQSVTSTSGESVTIPNTANYIMVLLFGSYSPDPLLPATTAVCNSLETLYATISMSHYDIELHGTYHNVDHYVKYDDESHKWSVSDANTSASIFYR